MKLSLTAVACLVLAALLLMVPSGRAVIVMNTDPANIHSQIVQSISWRYNVTLDPVPATPVAAPGAGGSAAEAARLAADFPGWNFVPGWPSFMTPTGFCAPTGGDAPGNLTVTRYDAGTKDNLDNWNLPDSFTVDYRPPPGGPWGPMNGCPSNLVTQWIQFVTTNDPQGGLTANTPYIDPFDYDRPFSDCTPFYWTEAERVVNTGLGGGVNIRFTDRPARGLNDTSLLGTVNWHADLFLVAWNQTFTPPGAGCPPAVNPGPTNVWISVHGVHWGFTITRVAMAGPAGGTTNRGGVAGDKNDDYSAAPADPGFLLGSGSVGGSVEPISKVAVLAPYGWAATILVGISALAATYLRHIRGRRQKIR